MTVVETLALSLAGLVLLETAVLLVAPGKVLILARTMAENKRAVMVASVAIGLVLLYELLQVMTLIQIIAGGFVVGVFYAVSIVPYYEALIDELEHDRRKGELWERLWPGISIWVFLSLAVIFCYVGLH